VLSIFSNLPLMAALLSIVAAQFIKVPLHFISNRSWDVGLAFSTGSMPSSHSAAVASLTAAIGLTNGMDSSLFAIAAVVSAITMFDAAGIRRHAGFQAAFLNRLMLSLPPQQQDGEHHKVLKELLGHRPIEVFVGAVLGIIVSFVLYFAL
jgi:acid phosphatase family membrane protein YuiD